MKKANPNPTMNEVVESLKEVIHPIEEVDTSDHNEETAAIVLAADGDDIILFGAGTVKMQATLIAALLKRQPILMLALTNM